MHCDLLLLSIVADCKDGDGLHCEKIEPQPFKVLELSFRQNQKCIMDYSSFKTWNSALVLNIKAMYTARVKVSKKDFSVLAGKQQNYRDRARLNCRPKNFPFQLA